MTASYLYLDITVGTPTDTARRTSTQRWVRVPGRAPGQTDTGRVIGTTELPAGTFIYVLFEDTGLCELYLEHLTTDIPPPEPRANRAGEPR